MRASISDYLLASSLSLLFLSAPLQADDASLSDETELRNFFFSAGLVHHRIDGTGKSDGTTARLLSDMSFYGDVGWHRYFREDKWRLTLRTGAHVLRYNKDQVGALTTDQTEFLPFVQAGVSYLMHRRFEIGPYVGGQRENYFLFDGTSIVFDGSFAPVVGGKFTTTLFNRDSWPIGLSGFTEYLPGTGFFNGGYRLGGGLFVDCQPLRLTADYAWSDMDTDSLNYNDRFARLWISYAFKVPF